MTTPLIQLRGVTKVYGSGAVALQALKGVDIDIHAGEFVAIMGPSGSGKSTAMNMLLPFLLEADVRRIDAAGEQTGVLRSWMLTGREEQQPVGYLWLEFERGGEYLVCGCGIRANQSTPKATTSDSPTGRPSAVSPCSDGPSTMKWVTPAAA